MKTNYFILLILLLNVVLIFAQDPQRDQDLITLKNGYQYLGYVVEQQPGKLIKIYRPTQNDTVIVNIENIDKLSKIMVQVFSEKKRSKSDTTLLIGRFNNKKNVYQFSYIIFQNIGSSNYGSDFIQGFGATYYRNFNNKYYAGLGVNFFINRKNTVYSNPQSASSFITTYSPYINENITQLQVMYENKFNLYFKPQKRRLMPQLGINAGYVFDSSTGKYIQTFNTNVKYEKHKGNFIGQVTLAIKINPDNNSGFIIEPGYSYYNPIIKQYDSEQNGVYLGYVRRSPHLFTFRLSYFF